MNLEQKLENLILKYGIDCCNPEYQQFIIARNLIYTLIEDEKEIALVAESIVDTDKVKMLIGENHLVYKYRFVDLAMKKAMIEQKLIICLMRVMSAEQRKLLQVYEQCRDTKVVFLYDYFEQQGFVYDREFYDVLHGKRMETHGEPSKLYAHTDFYETIYRTKKKYREAVEPEDKEFFLRQLIFDYVFIKDFISLKQYIEEYVINCYTESERYVQFQNEVEELLAEVKKITVKKTGQFFMFWVDALGKGEENGMPYFQQLQKESLYFENAFTSAPITSLTMKAIFLKKRFYEEKTYKVERIFEEDSSLLQYIKKENYVFQYYGFEERFEEKLFGRRQMIKEPSSMVFWNVLCDMCTSAQNKFYLIHSIAETHVPFRSGVVEDFYYDAELPAANERERRERHQQREEAKKYFDRQFKFYKDFINDENLQIIMSDHAGEEGYQAKGKGAHINLFVRGEGIRKGKIDKFFSYINFEELVKFLCSRDESILGGVLTDYVFFEYPDTYSKAYVSTQIKEKRVNNGSFGWKGCATYEDEYVIYTTGREQYFRYPSWMNRIALPEYADRIQILRKYVGEMFKNVLKDDYFQYSRLLHRIWENYIKRTGGTEIGVTCLCKSMEDILPDKVIAIRGGGRHTKNLLTVLGESATRIRYIVDKNKEICEQTIGRDGLQAEFITPGEMKAKKIDVVILSSLEYRKEMRDELFQMNQDYQILDVYEMLEEQGIYLNEGFYVNKLLPEDYEGIMVDE